ncbi:hypothetical protein [Eubacterium aggregans]|uniref:hypothetical protein n=1 Tax=Eubacterium aggregans TaxID=81409 RepID=UPI003F33D985
MSEKRDTFDAYDIGIDWALPLEEILAGIEEKHQKKMEAIEAESDDDVEEP